MLPWPYDFDVRSDVFDGIWKAQMLLGGMLIAIAIAIVIFPEILVALVASSVLIGGVVLMGSGWRLRRFQKEVGGFSVIERF